jgi:hypothetical protein
VRSYQILLLSSTKATPSNQTPRPTFGPPVNWRTLRKDSMSLKAKRICYSEEHPSNKMNQSFLPLFMQNETLQNRQTSSLSIVCLQRLPVPSNLWYQTQSRWTYYDKCYNFSLTSSLTLHLHFTSSFSNFAYLISLIPGHESLIYDSFYLSLTHVHCFDSPWTIIRYDSYITLTHTFSI